MEVKANPILEVQIKLAPVEAEKLTSIAARHGVSVSDLIRQALEAFLASAVTDGHSEDKAWQALGLSAFEAEWNNSEDAIYDNWRDLYGVGAR